MCGFIGLLRSDSAVHEIYDALVAIQHRGQDAAGISTWDGIFHILKSEGLVRESFDLEAIASLPGECGIGHVRYPTVGSGGAEDAQPFLVTQPCGIVMAHNGNVANYRALREEIEAEGRHRPGSHCDVEVILYVFADALDESLAGSGERPGREEFLAAFRHAVRTVFRRVRGSYSVVGMLEMPGEDGVAGRPALFAFRDPWGIKPIVFGRREVGGEPSFAVASESVVLDVLGFDTVFEPVPGGAILAEASGQIHRLPPQGQEHTPCLFEWVYFARPDSILDGVGVYRTRLRMGVKLAERFQGRGLRADVVIPVPDSARTAALACAQALGTPFREGLVKNRYIGRTFIMPDDSARRRSVRHKLNAIREEFEGRDILIVDDSIVRGNTSRTIVAMAREAGARRVYMGSTAPPLRHPCPYGIDMSTRSEFVARGREEEDVARALGADAVIYQDLEDLRGAVLGGNPALRATCDGCFTGRYPTGDITPEMLLTIEDDRLTKDRARQTDLPFGRDREGKGRLW